MDLFLEHGGFGVRVRIDETRHDVASIAVDHRCSGRLDLANLRDFSVHDEDVGRHGRGAVPVDHEAVVQQHPCHAVSSSWIRPASTVSGRIVAVAVATAPMTQMTTTYTITGQMEPPAHPTSAVAINGARPPPRVLEI